MDRYKNERLVIAFKKFSRLRVKVINQWQTHVVTQVTNIYRYYRLQVIKAPDVWCNVFIHLDTKLCDYSHGVSKNDALTYISKFHKSINNRNTEIRKSHQTVNIGNRIISRLINLIPRQPLGTNIVLNGLFYTIINFKI